MRLSRLLGFHTCRSKAALASLSLIKRLDDCKGCCLMSCYDHLCDAVSVIDDKRNIGMVDQNHLHLTSVIGIDSTRSVQDGDADFCSKT